MRKIFKQLLISELFIRFIYRFARAYVWTLRLKIENEQAWMDYLKNGGAVVLCSWHQQFFPTIRHFQKYKIYNPSIMISRSSDGEIVAGVAKHSGWYPVRGSSSKGGHEALKQMIKNLKKTKLVGHIVDGPRGPSGRVKAGVIRLAHVTNAVVVPVYISADKKWLFNSWDKFLLPKPFSKVTICFGEMIKFDRVRDEALFESQRKRLEEIMRPKLIV